MYGHESQPSRVYAYGAKPPKGLDADRIREQIDRSWRYRNDLVAAELDRRAAADRIIREHYPALVELDAQIEDTERELTEIREATRRANAKARTKDVDPERRARARQLRADRKGLRAEHRAMRKTAYADETVREALATLDAEDLARRKAFRAASGLHWGTYLTVEQGLSGIRSGPPPRFIRRSEWGGQVAVQVQGGASWDELVEGHGQCRVEIEPLPPHATPGGRRSKRPYCRVYLRVGSEGPLSRAPVWACARCVLHRPVPADGRIKWVRIVRRVEGTRESWSVQFVVARAAGWAPQDTHTASGVAALNLGWRSEAGEVRVAYVVGDDGHREELWIPEQRLSGWAKADSLEGIRDRKLTLAVERLAQWLAVEDVPEWLREETATLPRWRSQARLAALAIRWRERRWDGDAEGYEPLEAWRQKDRHLCDWAAAERAQYRRWRTDTYRRFAARLRWRYETLVVGDTDWRQLLRRPPAEEDEEVLNTRHTARLASPGLLRQIIEHGHPEVVRMDEAGATQTCHRCGAGPAHDWDRVSEIDYRCEAGHVIDQDRNAAENLLAWHANGAVVDE